MLRFLTQATLFLAAVCVAVGIFLLVEGQSPFFKQCINEASAYRQSDTTNQSPQNPRSVISIYATCSGTFSDHHAGGITAFASILIAAFTATLWITNGQQFRLGRDEFNATHRPALIVHYFEVARDSLAEGSAIGAQFIVVNKGTAEAIIIDIVGTIFMTAHFRPGSAMPSIGYAGRHLAGGESIRDVAIFGTTIDTAVADLNSGFGRKSTEGDPKLWCIGRITYADRQGRRRETGFCRSYDAVGERWIKEQESDYEYSY